MSFTDQFIREHGHNPEDFIELRCPTAGCQKPQIARPDADGGALRFDQCPCGFQVANQPNARIFLYAFSGPPFWALVHRDDEQAAQSPVTS
jgi:hypothetical protein